MTDTKRPSDPPAPLLPADEMADILRHTAAAKLFDRFGRPILLGCSIELHDELPPVYFVADAKPDLRPGAPQGQWILSIFSELTVMCRQGQRHQKMTLVAMPEEGEQGQPADPNAANANAAASDAPAPPPSSIVLTDMDRVARETLKLETMPTPAAKPGLSLVPPTQDAETLRESIGHRGELGEER